MSDYMDDLEAIAGEAVLDAFLEMLKEKRKEPYILVYDPQRVGEMQRSYEILSALAKETDPDAKVTYGMSELGDGSASLCIETNEFVVLNPAAFAEGICRASNFEIYPAAGGKIKIGIMFYGMAKEGKGP